MTRPSAGAPPDGRGTGPSRRLALALVLALLATTVPAPALTHATAPPSPILSLPFDEGTGVVAGDVAGGANHAVLTGASWIARDGGHAIRLDGVDDRVDLAANALHHRDALTISLWIRAHDGPPTPGAVVFEAGAVDCDRATFGLYATDGGIEFRTRPDAGLSGSLIFDHPRYDHIQIWDGAWHHVAASIDRFGNKLLAVDGFQLGMASGWVNFLDETSDDIALGGAIPGPSCGRPAFRGDVDDLRLYDRALDREQVGAMLPPVPSTITLSQPDPIYPRWMSQCVDVTVDPPPPGGRVRVELRYPDGRLASVGYNNVTCFGRPVLPLGRYAVPLDVEWAGDYQAVAMFEPGLPWLASQTQPVPLSVLRRPVSLQVFARNVMPGHEIPVDVRIGFGDNDPRGGTVTLVDRTGGGEIVLGVKTVEPVPSTQDGTASFAVPGRPSGSYTFEARFSGTPDLWAPATSTATVDVDDTLGSRGPISFGISPTYWTRDVLDVHAPAEHAQYVEVREPGGSWFRQGYHLPVVYPLDTFASTPRDGPVTIQVRWEDDGGRLSEIHERTLLLDRTAPIVTAGTVTVRASTVAPATVPVRVPWAASDATSGVDTHNIQVSRNGGTYRTVDSAISTQAISQGLSSGDTFRYRIRSRDTAGNLSPWVYGPTLRPSGYSEASALVRYAGTWSRVSASGYLGGAVRTSSRSGAKASVTFTGRSFAWVATTSPTRGKARVYVNGTLLRTVDLYARTVRHRQVVFTMTWTTSVARTVEIRVLGTAGRPRVDIDAILLIR